MRSSGSSSRGSRDRQIAAKAEPGAELRQLLAASVGSAYTAAVVAVSRRGESLFIEACGLLDPRDPGAVAHEDSLFDIASITKIFTAATFLRLVDCGKVRLETCVGTVVPQFEGRWKDDVTFNDMLAHTSGAPPSLKSLVTAKAAVSPEDIKMAVFRSPLVCKPHSTVIYSDVNFLILGEAVARLTGASLPAAMSKELLEPLCLSSTLYRPGPEMVHKIAVTSKTSPTSEDSLRGVVHDPVARMLGGVSGHAGLFSSARDVLKFANIFTNRASRNRILKADTIQLMTSVRASSGGDRRGLGWALNSGGAVPGKGFHPSSFGHNGFTGGSIWIDPIDGVAVAMLANRVYFNEQKQWPSFNRLRNRIHSLAKRLAGVDARVAER